MGGYVRLHCDEKTMLTGAIRTERLLLRSFEESDYDDLFEFLSQIEDDDFWTARESRAKTARLSGRIR